VCTLHAQTKRYVKEGGTGNGSSWSDASGDLQAMINASNSGDEVWVATGTYKPTTSADRSISFAMKNGVGIYGGFLGDGTEATKDQRNWAANPSILSGDIGTPNDISDNSYHVVYNYNNSLDNAAILDGFTITNGHADNVDIYGGADGSGMFNRLVSPTVMNCIFTGNTAVEAAIWNFYSNPVFINCLITKNNGLGQSGGIFNVVSSPILINCTISGNTSGYYYTNGAGITNQSGSNVVIKNSIVWGNYYVDPDGYGSSREANIDNYNSTPDISYSIVRGIAESNSNLNRDPLFVNATNYNFCLKPCSPAISAGNDAYNTTVKDLDGNNRKVSTIDIGAYEYKKLPFTGTIAYVNSAATGASDGSSWANAFTSLQDALEASCSVIKEIWVAKGTYKPTTDPNDHLTSFQMKNGVALYGGFSGDGWETDKNQRDWKTNSTMLSGDVDNNDINTDGNDIDETTSDIQGSNSAHVINNNYLDNTAILDGFTITGRVCAL
jgi:hypothetical protein